MKHYFFLISCIFLIFPITTRAAENAACDKKDYTKCYKNYWVENYCKGPSSPWNSNPGLGDVTTTYRSLDPIEQQKGIDTLKSSEKNPNEQAKIDRDLALDRIGSFQGFKSVEIARIQYRTNMNRIFSCAVTASRVEKLRTISRLISKAGSSEIGKKLENDAKKLEKLKDSNCGTTVSKQSLTNFSQAIARSATVEYCSYVNYLDYLDATIQDNYTSVMNLEKKIGNGGENKSNPSTIASAAQAMSRRNIQIENDLVRARSTLPKVLVAYREMERTYTVHLMLIIIYDDYLELRENLNTYLNAVSQLFEKAKNAQQSANK